MTESKASLGEHVTPPEPKAATNDEADRASLEADAERRLGRLASRVLPPVVVISALAVALTVSIAPALLVLIGGALIGTIALFWASLRTLGGDAPLAEDFEALTVRVDNRSALDARKRSALRALKDIQHEHAIGKIDDADFEVLSAKYRTEAKDLLRELDLEIEPFRDQAEALARKHLEKAGLGATANAAKDETAGNASKPEKVAGDAKKEMATDDGAATHGADAPACATCGTRNDSDADFCKKCGKRLKEEKAASAESDDA